MSPALRRRAGALFAAAWLGTAAALCGAQPGPTSSPPPPIPPGTVLPLPIKPNTVIPDSALPRPPPVRDTPRPGFGPPPPTPPAPASEPGIDIALVLPLDTPAYARAADAVRAGFLAAAEAAGAGHRCAVIAHGLDGVIGAFEAARLRSARVIVGPLVRDDLKTLAIAGGEWPVTIALNQMDEGAPLPPNTYSLALTVESDARVIARRAHDDGLRSVDVVMGESALMRRFATAFSQYWVAEGGTAPAGLAVEPTQPSLNALRRALARSKPDALVMALDGDRAALVKPYLGGVTVYASGLFFERPEATVARDFDDIRIVEVPWIVAPDAPEFEGLPRRDVGSAALTRLYALGLDAFRVAQAFVDGAPAHLELDGAIGHLSLDDQHQFVREGRLATFRDGQLVPLDPVR